MDEVGELIERRVRGLLADAYEAHGRKMTAARLRGGSVHEDMLVALDALTKALTVSPEKLFSVGGGRKMESDDAFEMTPTNGTSLGPTGGAVARTSAS